MQPRDEMEKITNETIHTQVFKKQLKLLLGSKEWMLFIIMLEMHTSPWEFKQHAHQRRDSGFQTSRIALH